MYNYIQSNDTIQQPESVSAFVQDLGCISEMDTLKVTEGYLCQPEVTSLELAKSSVVCLALDRFLFPGSLRVKGGCFHQLVSRHRMEVAATQLLVHIQYC